MAKIMHATPLAVSDYVVSLAISYANQQEPIVEALKYLSPLCYDAMTYSILQHLGNYSRVKLKDDGVNVSDWLVALAQFTGAGEAGVGISRPKVRFMLTLRSSVVAALV